MESSVDETPLAVMIKDYYGKRIKAAHSVGTRTEQEELQEQQNIFRKMGFEDHELSVYWTGRGHERQVRPNGS